uniref:Exportin-1/Importin-beta-like domain-containing protein n=1 Tax=Leersia perrieri TaxID=77586 RepID=A0A0D9XST1_9ORYZ
MDEASELRARLAAAVHALNHGAQHDPSARLAANQWLLALQRSPQAWGVATSLLVSPENPPPPADLLFFAAQMLRRKIQCPGAAGGGGAPPHVLDALLLAAGRFCYLGPPRLLTQISLALAALALRADGGVEGLFARMRHLPEPAVLELLTVLPEEVVQDQSGDTGVDAAARGRFTREVMAHAPSVLEFLLGQSDNAAADDERNRRVLRCLLSWVRVGCFSEMPPAALAAHPLLTFAFNSLQVPFSFDVAVEVMTELVSQYQDLPQAFLNKMPYIREALLLPALANRNEKIIAGLVCLMCEVGQAAPALVAEGSVQALALADALLRCSLAHFILESDAQTDKRNAAQELFSPVFSSLLDALLFRAQIDTDEHDTDGELCIPDGLAQFRMNLEELLVDICLLIGGSAYINKIFSGGWVLASQSFAWKEVEVRMYALSMGMDAGNLRIEDEEEIISAITHALCSVLVKELRKSLLARLLCSSYSAVEKLIDIDRDQSLRQNPAAYTEALNFAVHGLHRMGALFGQLATSITSGLIDDDTVLVLLGVFWPLLERLSRSSHMENVSLSAAACRSLSLAIHSCGQHFQILLPKVLECLSTNFLQFQRHDCFLRTAASVVEEFGHKEEYGALCVRTFETLSSAASISTLNSSYTCDQEPDLVEAYTNFASTFIRCCPKEAIVASGSLLELSFQKAAICSTAMHRGAALAAMSYMSCFLDVSLAAALESRECLSDGSPGVVLAQILARCGEGLMSNVHKSATILQQLAALCSLCERTTWKGILSWDSLCRWLQAAVKSMPSEYLRQGEAEMIIPLWLNPQIIFTVGLPIMSETIMLTCKGKVEEPLNV